MKIEELNRIMVNLLRDNIPHPDLSGNKKWIYMDYPRSDATFPRVSLTQISHSQREAGVGELGPQGKGEWQETSYDIDVWVKKGNHYLMRDIISNLTKDALKDQKECEVVSASEFKVKDKIEISDALNYEQNKIVSIIGNVFTVETNLVYDYTLGENGLVTLLRNRAGTSLRDYLGDQVVQLIMNARKWLKDNKEILDIRITGSTTLPYMDVNELFRRTVTIRIVYYRTKEDKP